MSLIVFQHCDSETPGRLGAILRDHGHRLRVLRLDQGAAVPADFDDVDGILSMGGPMNVDEAAQHPWMEPQFAYLKAAHAAGIPIVGICLGAQFLGHALGGKVEAMPTPEVGWQSVRMAFPGTIDPIYAGLTWDSMQFHMHGQQVTTLPPGATPLAGSKACRNQAFRVGLRTYAFQYHFEWNEEHIRLMARDALVAKAGASAAQIERDLATHYDSFARQGERLCHTIASLLFPLEKKIAV